MSIIYWKNKFLKIIKKSKKSKNWPLIKNLKKFEKFIFLENLKNLFFLENFDFCLLENSIVKRGWENSIGIILASNIYRVY